MRLIGMRHWYVPALSLVLLAACASEPSVSAESSASGGPSASGRPLPSASPSESGRPSASGRPLASAHPSAPAPPSALAWPPGLATSGPPRNPTDAIKKTDIVVGVVTRGGSGPCFGVRTDDGAEYALWSSKPLTLTRGHYVRLRTEPSKLRIDCGPGEFRAITAVEPVS